MKARLFQASDNTALAQIFAEAVRGISLNDYSAEQLEVWANGFTELDRWLNDRPGRVVFVAETEGERVGFATFEADGHINHMYVHPRAQRRGIASALLEQIESRAAVLRLTRIFTEASIAARPFFEHAGFRLIAPQTVERRGTTFVNFLMEKFLL